MKRSTTGPALVIRDRLRRRSIRLLDGRSTDHTEKASGGYAAYPGVLAHVNLAQPSLLLTGMVKLNSAVKVARAFCMLLQVSSCVRSSRQLKDLAQVQFLSIKLHLQICNRYPQRRCKPK